MELRVIEKDGSKFLAVSIEHVSYSVLEESASGRVLILTEGTFVGAVRRTLEYWPSAILGHQPISGAQVNKAVKILATVEIDKEQEIAKRDEPKVRISLNRGYIIRQGWNNIKVHLTLEDFVDGALAHLEQDNFLRVKGFSYSFVADLTIAWAAALAEMSKWHK